MSPPSHFLLQFYKTNFYIAKFRVLLPSCWINASGRFILKFRLILLHHRG